MSEEKSKTIKVDENLCSGCGTCVSECPNCFELGDDLKSHVKEGGCSDCNIDDVMADCPMGAISYE